MPHGTALLLPIAAAVPAAAAAAQFPAGHTGYHTHAEMVADINATVAADRAIIEKRDRRQGARREEAPQALVESRPASSMPVTPQ